MQELIQEVTRIDVNGEKITKNICYIKKFFNSARFIPNLSNLVINLSEGFHRIKCNFRHDDKNMKHVELNVSIVTVFLNIHTLKII